MHLNNSTWTASSSLPVGSRKQHIHYYAMACPMYQPQHPICCRELNNRYEGCIWQQHGRIELYHLCYSAAAAGNLMGCTTLVCCLQPLLCCLCSGLLLLL